jgi:hypothetical protein
MIMRNPAPVRFVFGMVMLLVLVFAPPIKPVMAAGTTRLEATGSLGTKAVLELEQAPLVVMKPAPFTLRTIPALPGAPENRAILCNLTMPAMPMPPNTPKVLRQGETFTGEFVFTMAGAWQAEFLSPLPGGSEERFTFTIDQVLLK